MQVQLRSIGLDVDIGAQSKSFASGLERGLIDEPLDAIRQLAYHSGLSKQPLKPSPIESQGDESTAYQAGKMAGKIAEFWLINRAVGAVSGIGHINALSTKNCEALKMGISGATNGVLTPVDDKNFAREKFSSIVSDSASFATFGAITGKAAEVGFLGRPGFRKFWQDATINATAGAFSGAVGADLNSIITRGELASTEALASAALQNALLGAGLSALDHSLPRSSPKIKADGTGIKGSAYSTEDWSAKVYDPKVGEIRSPILTWLADKNLVPKPPNYEELRSRAWSKENQIDLSLSDWTPQQRPAVIQSLRRVAHPDLGQDANIDAFLGRLTRSEIIESVNSYKHSLQPVLEATAKVKELMAANPAFKDMTPERLLYDQSLKPLLSTPPNAALQEAITQLSEVQRIAWQKNLSRATERHLIEELNGMAGDLGIPPLNSVNVAASSSSSRVGTDLYIGLGRKPEINALTAENTYHEFTHHAQGPLQGKETLAYFAKYPAYMVLKRAGLIAEIPTMQTAGTREHYIAKYIGSEIEKQAWATGLLVRIRAVAAGLQNIQD